MGSNIIVINGYIHVFVSHLKRNDMETYKEMTQKAKALSMRLNRFKTMWHPGLVVARTQKRIFVRQMMKLMRYVYSTRISQQWNY